ncbi:hypothetical protein GGI00_005185, partial [Coemansia sp. RSA 2681]
PAGGHGPGPGAGQPQARGRGLVRDLQPQDAAAAEHRARAHAGPHVGGVLRQVQRGRQVPGDGVQPHDADLERGDGRQGVRAGRRQRAQGRRPVHPRRSLLARRQVPGDGRRGQADPDLGRRAPRHPPRAGGPRPGHLLAGLLARRHHDPVGVGRPHRAHLEPGVGQGADQADHRGYGAQGRGRDVGGLLAERQDRGRRVAGQDDPPVGRRQRPAAAARRRPQGLGLRRGLLARRPIAAVGVAGQVAAPVGHGALRPAGRRARHRAVPRHAQRPQGLCAVRGLLARRQLDRIGQQGPRRAVLGLAHAADPVHAAGPQELGHLRRNVRHPDLLCHWVGRLPRAHLVLREQL